MKGVERARDDVKLICWLLVKGVPKIVENGHSPLSMLNIVLIFHFETPSLQIICYNEQKRKEIAIFHAQQNIPSITFPAGCHNSNAA